MSSRRQMGKSFGSGSEGSDSDDAPEEVWTSSWGKESEMARRERERLVKTRARDAAALKRKQMADRIRKQQEEAKAMRALAETVAKAKEGGDEGVEDIMEGTIPRYNCGNESNGNKLSMFSNRKIT